KAGGRRQRAEGSISVGFRPASNRRPPTFGLAGVLNPNARKTMGLLNRQANLLPSALCPLPFSRSEINSKYTNL
ncbi:MAG: hypothetical protein ACRC11_02430, partial [Xenococcaceae cyanobacterium]